MNAIIDFCTSLFLPLRNQLNKAKKSSQLQKAERFGITRGPGEQK